MGLGEFTQAAAKLPVADDGGMIEVEGTSTDMASFQARAPHPGTDALDD